METLSHENAAVSLVRFLSSSEAISAYPKNVFMLPSRPHLHASPTFQSDPILRVLAAIASSGRGFPAISLWGLIEDKLTLALENVWNTIMADSSADLDEAINQQMMPITERLNLTLSQSTRR
jgi:hypothetical protein